MKLKFTLSTLTIIFSLLFSSISFAEKKIYQETEFLDMFNGKPSARILIYLGEPEKKEMAIKPKDASSVIGRPTEDTKNPNQKDKIEMWYYSAIVEYAPNKTWKKIEFTFVNDRCANIAFFNQ